MRLFMLLAMLVSAPVTFASYHEGGGGSSSGSSGGGGYGGGGGSAVAGLLLLGGLIYYLNRDTDETEEDAENAFGLINIDGDSKFELDFNNSNDQYFAFDSNSSNFEIPTNRFQINLRYKLN